MKPLIEAYKEYLDGKFIKSPDGIIYNLKTNRLGFIDSDHILKYWQVKELYQSIEKVNKYKVLYKYDEEFYLSTGYYEDGYDFINNFIETMPNDESYKYEFIKLIKETESLKEKIVLKGK